MDWGWFKPEQFVNLRHAAEAATQPANSRDSPGTVDDGLGQRAVSLPQRLQLAQRDFIRFIAQSLPDGALRTIEGRLIYDAFESSLHQDPLLTRIESGLCS